MRRKSTKAIISLGLIAFILINIIAYNQAHAMLNFVPAGERTKAIESLTPFEKIGQLITGVTIPKPQNETTPADHQLEYERHNIDSDNIRLEAWYIPSAESNATILLFHGYAGSKDGLLDEAHIFHNMGYDTLLVDLRGSGGSAGIQTTVGVREGDDVAASVQFMHAMRPDQPIILYGRSMGAASILRALATTNIQPSAIVIEAVFAEMLTTVKNRFRSMGVPSFPAALLGEHAKWLLWLCTQPSRIRQTGHRANARYARHRRSARHL